MQRRSVLTAAGFLVGGRWITSSGTAAQSTGTWRSFQSDRQNTGYTSAESGPTTNVGQAWRYGTRGQITGGPVVADGRAYVPSQDGSVTAFELQDGSEAWTASVGDPLDTTPALLGDQIYVGGRSGTLYGLSSDGSVDMDFSLTDADSEVTLSGICTDGQMIYVLVGDYDPIEGWNEGKLTAVDPEIGAEIWSESLLTSYPHTPAIDDGTIYCYGIGAQDGANGSVLALDTTNGELEWAGGDTMGPGGLSVAGNSVIGTAGGKVTALSQSTGSTQWTTELADEGGIYANTSAAIAGRHIYVAARENDEFGYLYDIDLVSGERNGSMELYASSSASPTVTDQHIFAATDAGRIYAIRRSDLSTAWTIELDGAVHAPPAIVGDQLVIGTTDGYAVTLRDNAKTPSSTLTSTATVPRTATPTQQPGQSETTTIVTEQPMTESSTEATPSRGFFTNSSTPVFTFLNSPFLLTVSGFLLSVIGIMQQLVGGD